MFSILEHADSVKHSGQEAAKMRHEYLIFFISFPTHSVYAIYENFRSARSFKSFFFGFGALYQRPTCQAAPLIKSPATEGGHWESISWLINRLIRVPQRQLWPLFTWLHCVHWQCQGGRSYAITSHRMLMQCVYSLADGRRREGEVEEVLIWWEKSDQLGVHNVNFVFFHVS